MNDDDIIATLARRAEAGDGQAAVRLHKMSAAGIAHPALAPYRDWPRTAGRHRVRPRPRGRPMPGARYDAAGRYVANSCNTLWSSVPHELTAALALTLARAAGYRDFEAHERAAVILEDATGRALSADAFRANVTTAQLAAVGVLLGLRW